MVARTRGIALQGSLQCYGHNHRVLGCPGLAGPRAAGAGPAGCGRGAQRHDDDSYCARSHCGSGDGGGGGGGSSCRSAPPPLWIGGKQASGGGWTGAYRVQANSHLSSAVHPPHAHL